MDIFEAMYQAKDNSKKVSSFLEEYLLFEIYSPIVMRLAHQRWNELPYYVRDSVHPEMKELIQKANHFSTLELQEKIRAHLIVRAINVLLGYKNCPIPLTKDKHIPVVHQNILSNRGEWVLRRLLHAACHQEYTHDMAELALRASHKFLMNTDYYKKVNLDFEEVDQLVLKSSTKEKDENYYYFPILQLTQGCVFTTALNLAGNCGISVPAGLDPDTHMPSGIQLIAPSLAEERLFKAARAFELTRPEREIVSPL